MFIKQLFTKTTVTNYSYRYAPFLMELACNKKYTLPVVHFKRNIYLCKPLLKVRPSIENDHLYTIIASDILREMSIEETNISIEEDFNSILNRDWRNSNATNIVKAFKCVRKYCQQNNISVSDVRFDALVDGLMDHCDKLTDEEIIQLLICLSQYPTCDSYMTHNFHDIWSCLDDICCWKLPNWDVEKVLTIADLWYKLHLHKYSDFTFNALDRFVRKCNDLTKDQIVHIFFLFNICRSRPVDFQYEHALESKIKDLNIDELGVIALGYFKSKSKIKLLPIYEAMIKQVSYNSKVIHELTLAAIMKTLRYTNPQKMLHVIKMMLDKLYPELDRFSSLCCLHIALFLTVAGCLHKDIISKISDKLSREIEQLRLKDIERILNVLSMFNYVPKIEKNILDLVYQELHKESRLIEIEKHPRSLCSALNYLSLLGHYSYHHMNKIFDTEYITSNFGKSAKFVPREVLSLDCCIDIDCPEYKGKRLLPYLRYNAVKWHTEYAPSVYQFKKISQTDQLFIDTVDAVKKVVKSDENIHINHVLPHFRKAVIVACKDMKTNSFVKPLGFERYILGDVMVPFNDGSLKWYAVVVVGWNNTIKESSLPLGHTLMEERHLRKIGYKPILVIWNQFVKLTPEEKEYYISLNMEL